MVCINYGITYPRDESDGFEYFLKRLILHRKRKLDIIEIAFVPQREFDIVPVLETLYYVLGRQAIETDFIICPGCVVFNPYPPQGPVALRFAKEFSGFHYKRSKFRAIHLDTALLKAYSQGLLFIGPDREFRPPRGGPC